MNYNISKYSNGVKLFNGALSRYNLLNNVKDEAYLLFILLILFYYSSVGEYWIKLVLIVWCWACRRRRGKILVAENKVASIFRLQWFDSILARYFCNNLTNMIQDGNLANIWNFLSVKYFRKNDAIVV